MVICLNKSEHTLQGGGVCGSRILSGCDVFMAVAAVTCGGSNPPTSPGGNNPPPSGGGQHGSRARGAGRRRAADDASADAAGEKRHIGADRRADLRVPDLRSQRLRRRRRIDERLLRPQLQPNGVAEGSSATSIDVDQDFSQRRASTGARAGPRAPPTATGRPPARSEARSWASIGPVNCTIRSSTARPSPSSSAMRRSWPAGAFGFRKPTATRAIAWFSRSRAASSRSTSRAFPTPRFRRAATPAS